VLGIILSKDEIQMLTMYLDSDGSGDVDLKEFLAKINFKGMHERSHIYLLSEYRFIEFVLTVWYDYRAKKIKELIKTIEKFDSNHNGNISFKEFCSFINSIEKNVPQKTCLSLFKEVTALSSRAHEV
jgi:Ca2+-binding EF-hand superfamily protein